MSTQLSAHKIWAPRGRGEKELFEDFSEEFHSFPHLAQNGSRKADISKNGYFCTEEAQTYIFPMFPLSRAGSPTPILIL